MLISAVNVFTRNIYLLARIDSSYALSNVRIRLLHLVLPVEGVTCVHAMKCETQLWIVPPD